VRFLAAPSPQRGVSGKRGSLGGSDEADGSGDAEDEPSRDVAAVVT
jgi:hypothetical protein